MAAQLIRGSRADDAYRYVFAGLRSTLSRVLVQLGNRDAAEEMLDVTTTHVEVQLAIVGVGDALVWFVPFPGAEERKVIRAIVSRESLEQMMETGEELWKALDE